MAQPEGSLLVREPGACPVLASEAIGRFESLVYTSTFASAIVPRRWSRCHEDAWGWSLGIFGPLAIQAPT